MIPPGAVALTLLATVAAGCASTSIEQRTTEGLTAEQIFVYRSFQQNGRQPTFEERQTWKDDLDLRIARYLNDHPDVANSFGVTKFRYQRQASVGMAGEQVEILLGKPDEVTSDPARLEQLARRFWPQIRGRVTEAWIYPLGWNLYFTDGALVDITQYVD